ncbi:TRAP transporter small permease subunit [uncultured Ferrovibrio sp.]|jgi:TRAP-type mannitol/chloroaromatic compound transport system permease small subunit|uniref:TRAP transporter small permease subunit n=1 Tax=uncultured Ferrovibrio sp. TaxID=1576913 RepID=UPI00262F12F4|nr:TRAP transporter small permease subunit [uncultured Ferrovibrio sp.]
MERVAQRLDAIVEVCGRVTAWSSLAIVLVMAFNVLLRYAFNTGSVAMQELEWHLMAPIALLSMAYAIKHDGHVRVDVLYGRFSPRLQQMIEVISFLLVAAISVLIVYLSISYVMQSYRIGEGSPDPGGLPYRWILKACIPAGFILLTLQSLAGALQALMRPVAKMSVPSPVLAEHAAE